MCRPFCEKEIKILESIKQILEDTLYFQYKETDKKISAVIEILNKKDIVIIREEVFPDKSSYICYGKDNNTSNLIDKEIAKIKESDLFDWNFII